MRASAACTPSTMVAKVSSSLRMNGLLSDEVGEPYKFLDAQCLRPPRPVDGGCLEQPLTADALEALAQHLAALPECGFGHPRQRLFVGRQRVLSWLDMDDCGVHLRRRSKCLRRQ